MHPTFLFVAGLIAVVAGAEVLVRGAARLAGSLGVTPLVVGLTVVAFGTSSPELAVVLKATISGESSLSVGNVVGSNIFNILLILGLSAAIAPLVVSRQLIRLDVPIMIAASVFFFFASSDYMVGGLDGVLMLGGGIVYTLWLIRTSRREEQELKASDAAYDQPAFSLREFITDLFFILGGLFLLVTGADWLVQGAVAFATALGVSSLIIGLTVVAGGTSLPEVATSIVATIRGERDMAVGNVIGSNIYNICLVMGVSAALAPGGIEISSSVLFFDLPIMLAVAIACLPIFFTGSNIARWEGLLFLGYYLAYILYLILKATEHDATRFFGNVMLLFVIPITGLTLAIVFFRSFRASN